MGKREVRLRINGWTQKVIVTTMAEYALERMERLRKQHRRALKTLREAAMYSTAYYKARDQFDPK